MFGASIGQMFKFSGKNPVIREGAVFRHVGPGELVETAKVIKVGPDPMGIPHVRYEFMVEKSRARVTTLESRRTLNLESFASYFSEPVEV